MKSVAIIGGGAAGFFAAINIKMLAPNADVTIYEAAAKPLAKVRVSGGGRCNLTNTFEAGEALSKLYPRGEKLIRRAFEVFDHQDAARWFSSHGIELVEEDEGCIFPRSQSSEQIIDMFLDECRDKNIKIQTLSPVRRVEFASNGGFFLYIENKKSGDEIKLIHSHLLITTGGAQRDDSLSPFASLELDIKEPCPSLFSFNLPNDELTHLSGLVVQNVELSLRGFRQRASGALLISHWGVSGPATLRLSSYAARKLKDDNYRGTLSINWLGERNDDILRTDLKEIASKHPQKKLSSLSPFGLQQRLWAYLLTKANIPEERRWAELGSKGLNRIIEILCNDEHSIGSRCRTREEFVTCGGISLSQINFSTMESKKHANLYFAGEVLDVDGVTGGYNLQAAWSMAYVAAKSISSRQ